MLTKRFKSNKFYKVDRSFFKYGHDYDEIDGNTTVWDSLEKAKAFIFQYSLNRKFCYAEVEEIMVDREITVEDYKEHNYKRISSQKIYFEDYNGNFEEIPEEIYYYPQVDEMAEEKSKSVNEEVYKIYFGDDRTFGIQTVGLQSALELGQAYAKDHAGEKIVVIDEDRNIVKEFFEEMKEPVKNNIRSVTNFKPKYLSKKEYEDAYQSFSSLVRVGDIVDEQIVEEFRDCIPPVAYNARYLQYGEAYTHKFNPKTQKYEPAFMTFAKEVGLWVYKGICFYKEYEDVG